MDGLSPGFSQGFGAFVDRGSGRQYVVNDQYVFPLNRGRTLYRKAFSKIGQTRASAQGRLRWGQFCAKENVGQHGKVPTFAQGESEQQGLIKFSFSETSGVQGNGDNRVNGHDGGTRSRHQFSQ